MAKNPEFRKVIPPTEVFKGQERIYTLDHIPHVQRALDAIRSDSVGGEPFRATLRELGGLLGKAYLGVQTENTHQVSPSTLLR